MASPSVPDSLRFIRPYVQRAQETEKTYPLIGYFCKMQAISKIISQGAHNRDQDAAKYAEQLMTDLEAVRQSSELTAGDREILENEHKSQDYVLKFATSVLARAQSQIAQHTVTQGTAMTLIAASTFLDLVDLWPGKDQSEQIKFAKYHAARILNAVKQGDDPNDLYREDKEDEDDEDELEKELNALVGGDDGGGDGADDGGKDVPEKESNDGSDAGGDSKRESPGDSNLPPASASPSPSLPSAPHDSPKLKESEDPKEPESESAALPSVPGKLPGHKLPETPNKQPNNLGLPEAPEEQPGVVFEYERPPPAPKLEEFTAKEAKPKKLVERPAERPAEKPPVASAPTDIASILSQAEVTKSAQKHAKFAISALNYDDYKTAIVELESALEVLRQSEWA